MFDFLTIKKGVQELGGQLRKARADLESLRRQREEIAAAPITREDMLDVLTDQINAMADHYPDAIAISLRPFMTMGKVRNMQAQSLGMLLPSAAGAGLNMSTKTLFPGLVGLLREPILAGLKEALARAEWPAGAISMQERASKLDALDARIAELEKAEAELVQAADSAGVILR